ncbi:hypothetical protein PRZ48_005685 [Zasmidium cellare]|uniref:DUF7730 domain-containing protein n=1 Tax=Zasmidium cellare TaxID=395010 RepID=A0ABR0EM62_ZASCE|nr:hypothetical protein PRZ48_005685 [Zasmidium cellare]
MVDLGFWGDLALRTWVNINPSTQWANRQIEPYRGLPFGIYLHSARPRRQRTLTGPLDPAQESLWHRVQVLSSLESEQRTDEQVDCSFLQKLPYDVRVIIYEMVLGGNTLHLEAANPKSRILHSVCKHPERIDNPGIHIDCSTQSGLRPSSAPREEYQDATGFLPLLVTCRKIYSEAIGSLYNSNTFEFTQNFAAFTFLKYMLPAQRLPSIRHLRLHLRVPRHPNLNSRALRDWQDLWAFFGDEMSGLQSLYLQLQMLQPMEAHIESTSDDQAEDWIRPMVLMAVDARQKRGCKVELETRKIRHEPSKIFQQTTMEYPNASTDEVLSLTCTAFHERIRLSLG